MRTRIATSDAGTITVRGRDLVNELVGHYSFTEILFFLVCEKMPEPPDTHVLDACLITLMEHGLNPSTLIARLMADSVPDQVQVAMGAGVMAIGDMFAGTMEGCAQILHEGATAQDPAKFCAELATRYRAAKVPVPGFGHRTHKPDDPRTPRLLAIAAEAGHDGPFTAVLRQLGAAVDAAAGRHVTINATGAIAALLLEIGVPIPVMRAIAVVSRAGGLAGHVREEQLTGSARHIWDLARADIRYEDS
jgi:citrate synthase